MASNEEVATEIVREPIFDSVFEIQRTAAGRLSLKDATRAGKTGGLRLVQPSGERYLEDLGFAEGDQVTEQHLWDMETGNHLYPPVGSVSGRPVEMSSPVVKNPRRVKETLDITTRKHADKLGWSVPADDSTATDKTVVRRLNFDESIGELKFSVYRAETGRFQCYRLLTSALPLLKERSIKVNDLIDQELQQILFEGGHLYTEAKGRTRLPVPTS